MFVVQIVVCGMRGSVSFVLTLHVPTVYFQILLLICLQLIADLGRQILFLQRFLNYCMDFLYCLSLRQRITYD